jgi:Mg2+ and Co2+ transporter CorA
MNNEKKSSSLDELLANIESEHQQKRKLSSNKVKTSSRQLSSMKSKSSDSIDNYLAEIQSKLNDKQKLSSACSPDQTSSQPSDSDNFLLELKGKFEHKKKEDISQPKVNIDEDYLHNIAENFQAKRRQENEIIQQEKLEIIQQEELNKQRRRKQLTIKAKQWLKNLDPNSDEGFWFEQFADSYQSKLEAAIDYLEALS